jgi:hypothetical protein
VTERVIRPSPMPSASTERSPLRRPSRRLTIGRFLSGSAGVELGWLAGDEALGFALDDFVLALASSARAELATNNVQMQPDHIAGVSMSRNPRFMVIDLPQQGA